MSKKRLNTLKKLKLVKNNITLNRRLVPRKAIKGLRRFLKKQVKKTNKLLAINLVMSYQVFYKGKNPRMGRGKGSLSRLSYQVNPGHLIYTLSGFSVQRNNALKLHLKKFGLCLL